MSFPSPLTWSKIKLVTNKSNFSIENFLRFDSRAYINSMKLFKKNFFASQVEFIRRRQQQHISTIDTNSPSRLLLASNASSNSSFVPNSNIQIHKSHHNAIGYCTLRNGSLHGPSHMSAQMGNNSISMSPVPKSSFQNPSNTCTLPRHHNNHWPTYSGTVAGTAVRNMSQTITISQSQPPPPSCIAMQSLGTNARPRVCIGLGINPEDDAETPLMLKHESSVVL